MQYKITEAGIRYTVEPEPEPIPDDEVIEMVKSIAAKLRADLEACGCVQQDAQPCGACESASKK